jgi:acyl carrier protein
MTVEQIMAILSKGLDRRLKPADELDEIGLDDLDICELYSAIEEESGCEVPEIDRNNFFTVGDLAGYVAKCLEMSKS